MDRKRTRRLAIVLICIIALMAGAVAQVHATEKTDGKNMHKVLKYYKKGKYGKAGKYGKKMPSTARESAVQNMSSGMKKAYLNKVRGYVNKYGLDINDGGSYIWDYFLTDINNDGRADLIIEYGSCEADVRFAVFQYRNGKAKKLGRLFCGHTAFHAYPKHNGIVLHWGHMGYESLYHVTIKDGKLTTKVCGDRILGNKGRFIHLGCALKSHVSYDGDYNKSISYKDLR